MLCIQPLCCPGLLLPSALLTVGLCGIGQCSPERPALNELLWLLGAVIIVLTQHLTYVNWAFWETTCSCPTGSVLTFLFCSYFFHYLECLPLSHRKVFLYQRYPNHPLCPGVLWETVSVAVLHELKITHLLCLFQNALGLLMFWPMFFQHILNSDQCV